MMAAEKPAPTARDTILHATEIAMRDCIAGGMTSRQAAFVVITVLSRQLGAAVGGVAYTRGQLEEMIVKANGQVDTQAQRKFGQRTGKSGVRR